MMLLHSLANQYGFDSLSPHYQITKKPENNPEWYLKRLKTEVAE